MKILVLGISGMLGNAVFRVLSDAEGLNVIGTARNKNVGKYFNLKLHKNIVYGVDALDQDALLNVLEKNKPDVVINCIGLIKQLENSNDPLIVLPINSLLPHRLERLCDLISARLIHMSTDCVFSGNKGMYSEYDESDARDLYGKSKYIGEIPGLQHVITLRTSIIGHELSSSFALLEWFLSQNNKVKGYSKAIFSGVTTIELARIIRDYVLPEPSLSGVYHVSSEAIDKMALLKKVAKVYGKKIEITPDEKVTFNRSLDSSIFKNVTNYKPPSWDEMIQVMYEYNIENNK